MNTNLASYIMGMVIDEMTSIFVRKMMPNPALDKAEEPASSRRKCQGLCLCGYEAKGLTHDTWGKSLQLKSFGWGRSQKCVWIWESFVDTGLPR